METPHARAQRILQADKDNFVFDELCSELSVCTLRLASESCSVLDVLLCVNAAQKVALLFDRQQKKAERLQLFIWLANLMQDELSKAQRSYLYRKCCLRKARDSQNEAQQTAAQMGSIAPFLQPLSSFSYS